MEREREQSGHGPASAAPLPSALASLAPLVDTEEYRRSTAFSRWLRERLRGFILPRAEPALERAWAAQFDEASRNVEIAAEGLGRLLRRHPVHSKQVLRAVGDWLVRYFWAQHDLAQGTAYLVYTEEDRAVPFVPEADTLYTYMIAQIAYVANGLAEVTSAREMHHISTGFVAMNDAGVTAFRRHPTLMPRFLDHDRLSLRVIQAVDRPLNCCPSLHIAYSLFLDGVAERFLRPHRRLAPVFDSIRYSTVGMFNSVLYTKQHSLLDVAFGMVCARQVFERWFGQSFADFTDRFGELARIHPIPYDVIDRMYREAWDLVRAEGSLAAALGRYLSDHGFARLPAGEPVDGRYFDTRLRTLLG